MARHVCKYILFHETFDGKLAKSITTNNTIAKIAKIDLGGF